MKSLLFLSILVIAFALHFLFTLGVHAAQPKLALHRGDRICLIGNTLAERMQYFNHFETRLHSRFPEHDFVVRNLGWSADELSLRPRPEAFQGHGHSLYDHKADVVIAFLGFNESFAGPDGLAKFRDDLTRLVNETKSAKFNGRSAARLVLISPIACENLGERTDSVNSNIRLYTDAMAKVASDQQVVFVDLFAPTKAMLTGSNRNLTINGIHLSDDGYRQLAPLLEEDLFGSPRAMEKEHLEKLRHEVAEKNLQFFYDHRTVNGDYIFGARKEPFGEVNFPHEFSKLRKMIAVRDHRVWKVARGQSVPPEIDDRDTGELPAVRTNYRGQIKIRPPEEAIELFRLPDGYQVNLFASEADFPELKNPVQMTFDARGRLWLCVMPSYPMVLPGTPPDDKLLILEDIDGDGKADTCKVFVDGLHLPTGFELGDGGAYIAQQPNLMFCKDTDGDDRADTRELILHGFGSADSHHAISVFTWGPGGGLYFQEGAYLHTSVETPYGPVRNAHGGIYRYEPRTNKFETFVSYNFANPWGHVFDRWGQNFVSDSSFGENFFVTPLSGKAPPFTGQTDFGPYTFRYRRKMKPFIRMRVRPTAGCELVSSRHFPKDAQGWFLLSNCIGEQSVLRHKVVEVGSGFEGKEIMPPLLRSTDQNFRPIDLKFGLDGALYVVDWFNPLIGHMQHSLRDPNRDRTHGRIWRVTYQHRDLLEVPKIVGASISELLDLLKTYENRTRDIVRRELRDRDTQNVIAALKSWLSEIDPNDPDYEHHLLEALWVHQHHDVVDEQLLRRLLRSSDYHARAAATRVLCYWRDRVNNPIDLLREQALDDHPRVALEAVRAASFFQDEAAFNLALSAREKHADDAYIDYTLKETISTLQTVHRSQ